MHFLVQTPLRHVGQAPLLLCAFLSAASVTAQEVHSGITFDVQFSNTSAIETTPIKDPYEATAAQQASIRLQTAINETGIAKDCLTNPVDISPTALYALKDCIANETVDGFFMLLADDIEASNTFWDRVVTESTSDMTQWVPTRAYVTCYFGAALNATSFAEWTLSSSLVDAAELNANPEHYLFALTDESLTEASAQIFEGWGGVLSTFGTKRTNFTVPAYEVPDFGGSVPAPWSLADSFNLELQRIGPKVLAYGDGNTFGYLHIAVRDVPATTAHPAAIQVYSAVWYPPWDQNTNTTERQEFLTNYIADEAHHMVVEVVNLSLKAAAELAAV
ncbi:hypothetical protein OIDMADRAFT_46776 [Oidiodendron maius Zn]|uniref:Uncharacterized protein n=1 Tax=Oidiodendron maius (strain Zn) TaxID=913774 RepID=A0A0C3HF39_OIDMZ|nr:hypothetical protein OIDMADRAFT_46776 [Oidiodendron maius Zn]